MPPPHNYENPFSKITYILTTSEFFLNCSMKKKVPQNLRGYSSIPTYVKKLFRNWPLKKWATKNRVGFQVKRQA